MYQPFQSFQNSSSKAAFPSLDIDWKELIYFRNWQAEGIVRILYYFIVIAAFINIFVTIITTTIAGGVGGFFLGLLTGVLGFIFSVLFGRIICEIFLSIFLVRDSMDTMAHGNKAAASSAPQGGQGQHDSYQAHSSAPEQSYDTL